jgi:hypothetical protein
LYHWRKTVAILVFIASMLAVSVVPAAAFKGSSTGLTTDPEALPEKPVEVTVGARFFHLNKIDISSNSYTLDFYLWFEWDEDEIRCKDVESFEFLNGRPEIICISNETEFIEYRVIGDFVCNFDCRSYPFDAHRLQVMVEHQSWNCSYIVYVVDEEYSKIDEKATFSGWTPSRFNTGIEEHDIEDALMSDFVFSVDVIRPVLNSLVKYVLPITVITLISLLTFFIEPTQFGQRITVIVTTLIAASATHIGIINGLPVTAYLTVADRIMFVVYVIFLANLGVTVYLMRLVNRNKFEEASAFNRLALRLIVVLCVGLLAVQYLI